MYKAKKLQCAFCDKDISKEIFASCAECDQLLLCLDCLAAGVEDQSHNKTHDYRIQDGRETSLFAAGWTAEEELALLDAVEAVGMGRWADVAHRVAGRTAADCQSHYVNTYLKCSTAPLPELLKKQNEEQQPQASGPAAAAAASAASAATASAGETTPGQGPTVLSLLGLGSNSAAAATYDPATMKLGPDLAGFYTKRGDYEVEYMNKAETGLDSVVFYPEDSEQDRALKTALIEVYNRRLLRRIQRRALAEAFGINNPQVMAALTSTEEHKAIYETLKPLCRFHAPARYVELLLSLQRRSELLKRVQFLQELRRNGVTTLADGETYRVAQAERNQQREARRSTQRQKGSNGINGAAVTATHTTKAGRVATKKY